MGYNNNVNIFNKTKEIGERKCGRKKIPDYN